MADQAEDVARFQEMLNSLLRGEQAENLLDGIVVYLIKEAEKKDENAKEIQKKLSHHVIFGEKAGRKRKRNSKEVVSSCNIQGEGRDEFPAVDLFGDRVMKPVSNVDEVIAAVLEAKATNTTLRVAGSCHSISDAIFSEESQPPLLLINDLRKIEYIGKVIEDGKEYLDCRVGAGCNLGRDPMNPKYSTIENSVCYQIAEWGYGFPELGGIIHQTVGGFMMTGSAGGSLKHGFADVIRKIEFVDGNGKTQVADPKENPDLWSAVGVSMGLFGIITYVTFRLPKLVLIKGNETGYKFADSSLSQDDSTGQCRLQESLENHEYFRANWFPQKDVKLVQEWSGEQTLSGHIVPYHSVLECPLAAGMAAIILSICDYILQKPNPTNLDYCTIGNLLKVFVSMKSESFCDYSHKTLPMDNYAHVDCIIRVHFTEIWIPINQCQTVMEKLQNLFENQKAAGNFATEIYGAKKSPFWLSMSYNGDMVRVDPYWWAYNRGDLREYFSFFWDVLLDIPGTCLHWGKYLPRPGQKCGSKTFNLTYLKSVYPKMDEWLNMRAEMDPDQVFVTDYWREILEIPGGKRGAAACPI